MNSYNDGVIYIYESKETLNSFNAKINETSLDDFDLITELFFKEESKREQDLTFANSLGRTLSLKISVPYTDLVLMKHRAVYNNVLYDIYNLDYSTDKRILYIYLERVRELG